MTTPLPELDELRRRLELLRHDPAIVSVTDANGVLSLRSLPLAEIARLIRPVAGKDEGYHFLMAASELNRSSLKDAAQGDVALVVPERQRKAQAIRVRLPVTIDFDTVAARVVTLRQGDLKRKARGQIEQLFRDRLVQEGIPLLMSPPLRQVPGLVVTRRKPDGVWPDPATGAPPVLYLEIKNISRVADDIQKRLYELVETSLEMKLLYGTRTVTGLGLHTAVDVADPSTSQRLREQITGTPPFVVALLVCRRDEAEKYRAGAEAFIDRIFFQEEIDECLDFLSAVIEAHPLA